MLVLHMSWYTNRPDSCQLTLPTDHFSRVASAQQDFKPSKNLTSIPKYNTQETRKPSLSVMTVDKSQTTSFSSWSTREVSIIKRNKTKVIRANLLEFAFDLDFNFEDIFRFGNISVLLSFQFW